MIIFLKIS